MLIEFGGLSTFALEQCPKQQIIWNMIPNGNNIIGKLYRKYFIRIFRYGIDVSS